MGEHITGRKLSFKSFSAWKSCSLGVPLSQSSPPVFPFNSFVPLPYDFTNFPILPKESSPADLYFSARSFAHCCRETLFPLPGASRYFLKIGALWGKTQDNGHSSFCNILEILTYAHRGSEFSRHPIRESNRQWQTIAYNHLIIHKRKGIIIPSPYISKGEKHFIMILRTSVKPCQIEPIWTGIIFFTVASSPTSPSLLLSTTSIYYLWIWR